MSQESIENDFLVLGGDGLQGRVVVDFLVRKKYRVIAVDLYDNYLRNCKYIKSRFSYFILDIKNQKKFKKIIKKTNPSVIVNCAEGDLNLDIYKTCLAEGRSIIDLGSDDDLTKHQLALHEAFKKKGLIAITGCGSTPGINNLMCRFACDQLDAIDSIEAGFAWNSNTENFVVPFSIPSILYELTDEAIYLENNVWKKILPSESVKSRTFKGIGKQLLFLVPHPEVRTFFKLYKNKGVENIYFYAGFPQHSLNILKALIAVGFNNKEAPLNYFGKEIYPTEFLARLTKNIPIPNSYREVEELWVKVNGKRGNKKKEITMSCRVRSLLNWIAAGSNVDTSIPAALIAEMILKNEINRYGSFTMEESLDPMKFFRKIGQYDMRIFCNGKKVNRVT